MAVWSPAGETPSGEMGQQKSPSATTASAVSPAASAASTAAESAVTAMSPVTGTQGKQAGLAHWMSVMAEHMNSAESSASVQSYAWQNGLEVPIQFKAFSINLNAQHMNGMTPYDRLICGRTKSLESGNQEIVRFRTFSWN